MKLGDAIRQRILKKPPIFNQKLFHLLPAFLAVHFTVYAESIGMELGPFYSKQ